MNRKRDLTPEDEEFLNWLGEVVSEDVPPIPIPLEVRLNEMTRTGPPESSTRLVPITVLALVIVIVLGMGGLDLTAPANLLGVALLAGVFASALLPAAADDAETEAKEV